MSEALSPSPAAKQHHSEGWVIADSTAALRRLCQNVDPVIRSAAENELRRAWAAYPPGMPLARVIATLDNLGQLGNLQYYELALDEIATANPILLFPEQTDPAVTNKRLEDANIHPYPKRYPVEELTGIEGPVVIKNPTAHRGNEKLLLVDEKEKRFAREILLRLGVPPHIIVEQYIQNPGKHATTLRILGLPDGTLLDAKIISNNTVLKLDAINRNQKAPKGAHHGLFAELQAQLPQRNFMSNAARGGMVQPLRVSVEQEFIRKPPESKHKDSILAAHGIDPRGRLLPDKVRKLAQKILKILGPSSGVLSGVDIILSNTNQPYLLEVNSAPAIGEIWTDTANLTSAPPERNSVYNATVALSLDKLERLNMSEGDLRYYLAALEQLIMNSETKA